MDDGVLGPLLKNAKVLVDRYEWLEAIESYKKASEWFLKTQDFLQTADLYQKIGHSFFRAALQAETNTEFRKRMTLSAESYKKMVTTLKKIDGKEGKISHGEAMVAWIRSWIQPDFARISNLLDEWWNLENKALGIYQKEKDLLAIGKTCNNLMEGSIYHRIFISAEEFVERTLVCINFGEKAIKALLETNNNYELARAYTLTAWLYGILSYFYVIKPEDEPISLRVQLQEYTRKWQKYTDKAILLCKKTGDAWLIGWSHDTKALGLNKRTGKEELLEHSMKLINQGKLAKDNYLLSKGLWHSSAFTFLFGTLEEDTEKRRHDLRKALKWSKEALRCCEIIAFHNGVVVAQYYHVAILTDLANLEVNFEEKRVLLQEAIEAGRESYEVASGAFNQGQIWSNFYHPMGTLCMALFVLSEIETDPKERRRLLEETLKIQEKEVAIFHKIGQVAAMDSVFSHMYLGVTQSELAKITESRKEKIQLLHKAVSSYEKGLEVFIKNAQLVPSFAVEKLFHGRHYLIFGGILTHFYSVTKEQKLITKAIEAYRIAIKQFQTAELPTYLAETNWKIAKLEDELGNFIHAADNYENAAREFEKAAEKIPGFRQFYLDHSFYMKAWSHIERARSYHLTEEYDRAKNHYGKAAKLHEATEHWSYLAPNYLAWSELEKAEALSRKELTQQAILVFQKTIEQFSKAETSIKQKLEVTTSAEEKEMILRLSKASKLRSNYCRARVFLEKAKLLDREGKHLQSSKSYGEAAQNISAIVLKVDVEAERKELELLATLCRAWEKMAMAEETTSSESYLDAAALFERARELCFTKKASLWALGNSTFCKGLAAGIRYQDSMNLEENALAKEYVKNAASNYLQAGFKNASEYAKATQRLFDAYALMNQAEREVEPEKRAKRYQMVENLLQIAAGSYTKAKQPEKTDQVQQILETVREEKALAISLTEVMHAPTVTSSTFSFTAPTPTNEASVGLESFEHANVQANLVAAAKEVKVGESFCLSIEFVNAGKEPALLTRVEEFIPPDFLVVKKPDIYRLEENCLNMKGKQLAPLKLVEAKLVLQPSKRGVYQLKPRVNYLDELGQKRFLELKSLEIKVEEVILANRVSTGTKELDSLLLGGIPEEYAVALTGPPSDEREAIVRSFLEAGTKEEEFIFYVTSEAEGLENLLDKPNFYLFLCNPKPKVELPDSPNIYKLGSKTNLTNLSIALSKAYRRIGQATKRKRVCIEIVSDVLLRHKAEATRRWISELITDLGSKGFTMIAVINPDIHPHDQARAVIDLFDGEISLTKTKDTVECRTSIRVEKLRNQDYIKNPICLTGK